MDNNIYDGQPISESFARYVAAAREAARILISVHPEDDLGDVADEMESVVEQLREKATMKLRQHESIRRTRNPVSGPTSAIAPEFAVNLVGDRAIGRMIFNEAYQGPPGVVHGGIVAAAFDELLGRARHLTTKSVVTGSLSVRYFKPTPINQVITGEAWVVEELERKMIIKGVLRDGDVVTAEAEGVFVYVDRKAFNEVSKAIFAREPGDKEKS